MHQSYNAFHQQRANPGTVNNVLLTVPGANPYSVLLLNHSGQYVHEARACLRSATAGRLLLPTTDTVTVGRRGFYYAGPAIWNSVPSHMTDMPHVNVTAQFLADRTNGRAYATVLCLSVRPSVCDVMYCG